MRNETFLPGRFARYFACELGAFRKNCGLTLLLTCSIPFIYLLLHILFTADIYVDDDSSGMRWLLAIVAICISVISLPIKLYGNITDRRSGPWWTLTPVSVFEKYLSMVLMTCVVLPVCFFGLYAAADALVCLIPGDSEPLVSQFLSLGDQTTGFFASFGRMSLCLELWLNWCAAILTFTLGAIFFHKGKASKTILVIIVFSMLLSTLSVWTLNGIDSTGWDDLDRDAFLAGMHTVQLLLYFAADVILLAGLYFRLKTIKY